MEPELAEIENAIKSLALADKDSVKEMAAKTTELAAKLDAILNRYVKVAKKQMELRQTERLNVEIRAKLTGTEATERVRRKKIKKCKKRQIDTSTIRRNYLAPEDEVIYQKDVAKAVLLNAASKLRFRESTTADTIKLEGYVFGHDGIITFEHQLPRTPEARGQISGVLWKQIKSASQHTDHWEELFADDAADSSDDSNDLNSSV